MAYINGKKVLFSPKIYLDYWWDGIPDTITIACTADGTYKDSYSCQGHFKKGDTALEGENRVSCSWTADTISGLAYYMDGCINVTIYQPYGKTITKDTPPAYFTVKVTVDDIVYSKVIQCVFLVDSE